MDIEKKAYSNIELVVSQLETRNGEWIIPEYTASPQQFAKIDLSTEKSIAPLAEFIYCNFHACIVEIPITTSRFDIFRYFRSSEDLSGEAHWGTTPIPILSFDRSPGFIHVFSKKECSTSISFDKRIYISENSVRRRVESFLLCNQLFNSKNLSFQGKISWNTSVKRSDDIVFYFQNEEHYTIAKKLVVNADTKIGSNDKNSIFTESIRGGISCAVDDLRQERDDLSFGQKKSRELAEKVIHFLQDFRGN